MSRRGASLSFTQVAAMAGSLVVVYYIAANHAALKAWFAAGQPAATAAAAKEPQKA